MGNHVSVGSGNKGNIAGRDVIDNSNQMMPCKNGDGVLSKSDYEKLPYCNNCIEVSRRKIRVKYTNYAQLATILMLTPFFYFIHQFPNFLSFLFSDSPIDFSMISRILSFLTFAIGIFLINITILSYVAKVKNDKLFPLHK